MIEESDFISSVDRHIEARALRTAIRRLNAHFGDLAPERGTRATMIRWSGSTVQNSQLIVQIDGGGMLTEHLKVHVFTPFHNPNPG